MSSFTTLTRAYFNTLESLAAGGHETNGTKKDSTTEPKTRIKYVGGSVEAACALGIADGIVDLVGTQPWKHTFRLCGLSKISSTCC